MVHHYLKQQVGKETPINIKWDNNSGFENLFSINAILIERDYKF